ncbi:MAG: pentapeptide repeat-containing protein [Nannocystaceae bacterium]|nr:pentapeptide repeat-containing protein [bacterium]
MSASSAAENAREAVDFAGQDLRGRDFTGQSLVGANFAGADLTGAVFYEADVSEAEFTGATLDGANLEQARATRACFGNASMKQCRMFGADLTSATLSGADLTSADLRNAALTEARMVRCTLDEADLECAALTGASTRGSSCFGTNLNRAKLAGACLRELEGAERASWLEAEITSVDFTGAYLLRRHILDQNYLHEFQNRGRGHRILHWVWWVTSDCGRSMLRWGVCTAMVAVFFGLGYLFVDVDFGDNQTLLSPFYFSLVTITTLGYGDVLPRSMSAQVMVMAEVAIGYMMLGGMLSIFSNKMARRAG